MLFWIWLRPRYKIPELFTIAPVLTATLTVCRRNRGDLLSLYRSYGVLQVLQVYRTILASLFTYLLNYLLTYIFVLVWPGAAHAPIAG